MHIKPYFGKIIGCLSLACLFLIPGQTQTPPNVIFILADDLGYGDLSCYGQVKFRTPNIDRLANKGMRFTQHYSGNAICTPSRACLMTGQHPGHCHVRTNVLGEVKAHLPPDMTTLPKLFKLAGYVTGAFGKWGLGYTYVDGPANPLNNGFDEFYGTKTQFIAHTYYPTGMVHNGKIIPLEPGTYAHDLVVDHAFSFIRQHAGGQKPFFCYLPVTVPHAAMQAPESIHEKWREKLPEFDDLIGTYFAGEDEPCPDVVNPIAGFAAMIENLDNQVGQLLYLLKELGVSENTLIFFTSDNGPHREGGHDPVYWDSNGPLCGFKNEFYEGGLRAPLLAYWPETIRPGKVCDHISAFWDFLPTIAELLNQPLPAQTDGISFLPSLLGQDGKQKKHEYLYWELGTKEDQPMRLQTVRKGNWKAIRIYNRSDKTNEPVTELYNLKKDLAESNDLAAKNPKVLLSLEKIMEEAHVPLGAY